MSYVDFPGAATRGSGLAIASIATMQKTAAVARERFDVSALLWAGLAGELLAAVAYLASGNVPPVLLRSLQLFLRF
jgi:hypothetical protein